MHISNHIHEWRRRHNLKKAQIPKEFIVDWFIKLLQHFIAKGVSLLGVQIEDQAIVKAQQIYFGVFLFKNVE